ncbi:hypothetical protein FQZ97_801440 [compost metagenome]
MVRGFAFIHSGASGEVNTYTNTLRGFYPTGGSTYDIGKFNFLAGIEIIIFTAYLVFVEYAAVFAGILDIIELFAVFGGLNPGRTGRPQPKAVLVNIKRKIGVNGLLMSNGKGHGSAVSGRAGFIRNRGGKRNIFPPFTFFFIPLS